MPGPRPAKLCLCSAAQCCADAFQIPAIPWPSFSLLRSALPPRFGTMPVRSTAVPWLRISLPAPPGSVLCPRCADHIRRSTILCRRISIQSQSVPLHVRSVLSRAMPLPCLATLCPSLAVLFPGIALLHSDAPCQDRTTQLSAFPFPCFSVQCYAQAFRCYALPMRCYALPKLFHAYQRPSSTLQYFSEAFLCTAVAAPCRPLPFHCSAFPVQFRR